MSIAIRRQGGIEYLASDQLSVPHGFTTRHGGVSTGHLSSLNLGPRQGDDPAHLLTNYHRLGEVFQIAPEKLVLAYQTHSDHVRQVGAAEAGVFAPTLPDCDALITNEPGIGLVVFAADCTPILLQDPVHGAVAAVHAGWRGTAAAIVGKTVTAMVEAFGSDPTQLRAAIGPCIGACCFETGADVPQAMRDAFGTAADAWIQKKDEDRYHVDLKGLNAMLLRAMGVRHLDISTACTACDPDRFWSHRITGGLRGAQGALIICKEPSA